MCLPIFLSGCKQLLMLVGKTYVSRLWVRHSAGQSNAKP